MSKKINMAGDEIEILVKILQQALFYEKLNFR